MDSLKVLKELQNLQAMAVAENAADSFFVDVFSYEGGIIISVSAYKTDDMENDDMSECYRIYPDTPQGETDRIISKIKGLCKL